LYKQYNKESKGAFAHTLTHTHVGRVNVAIRKTFTQLICRKVLTSSNGNMNSSGIRSAFMIMIHYEYKYQYNNKP